MPGRAFLTRLALFLLALGSLAAGMRFQSQPYRLERPGAPVDLALRDYRDSVYSHVSWLESEVENYAEMRFFGSVQGAVCQHPSWHDLEALERGGAASLGHLVAGGEDVRGTRPDGGPGTLTASRYTVLFPLGVLANRSVVAAGRGDLRLMRPRVLVIGLGVGAGIASLVHHFPMAEVEVVEIDQVVVDMVREHYPLLDWLEGERTPHGRPRLTVTVGDARRVVRERGRDGAPAFDLVVIDAYASGGSIPAHLMTREFFEELAAILAPEGLVLANLVASRTGPKRLVLGGALRALRAAGLGHGRVVPVTRVARPEAFRPDEPVNQLVLASRSRLPDDAYWASLEAFTPYWDLPLDTYLTSTYYLSVDDGERKLASTLVGASAVDAGAAPALGGDALRGRTSSAEPARIELVRERVRRAVGGTVPLGWDVDGPSLLVHRETVDWVLRARNVWHVAVGLGRNGAAHSFDALIGPPDGVPAEGPEAVLADAPLFTDAQPNADILYY